MYSLTDCLCACVQPPFDRDFPSLAGRSNVGKSWHSGAALPEQQWTRLADAPDGSALSPRVSNPRTAEPPLAEAFKPFAPKLGSGPPVDVPGASHARKADTVQQVTLLASAHPLNSASLSFCQLDSDQLLRCVTAPSLSAFDMNTLLQALCCMLSA